MGGYAWVTLATNNSYSLGALVLAHSLKKSNTAHKLVVLVTSSVSESMRNQLNTVFDVVKLVDVLDSKDEAHLALMQRPELGITFTKIHCWRLIEFEKCVFLDADTLVVRNCDELFEREEFSAAPDASWPDCFNSGVFVFRPSIETFNKILQFAVENKSFDGGDQGLLNQFFSSWATEDIKKHLPFVYNLTSFGSYAYIPAFKHYGSETRIVHFIGTGKPWLQQLDIATKTVKPSTGYEHLAPLLQQWWDLFCEKVHPNLDKNLESSNEEMSHSHVEACSNSLPIALTDEPQTLRLIPCTPHEEKVVTEHKLPFKINDSSGESPKPFVFVPETKQVRSELIWTENICRAQQTPENIEEGRKECTTIQNRVDERDKEEKKEQQPQEEPPPKDPFDYESFFPDESCIKNYLQQNVETYQPFEHQEEVKIHKKPEPLPRFLTIPEDDRRQSGNVDLPVEKHEPQKQPTPEEETRNTTKRETPPRETLTKSKSMPFLPLEVTPEPPKPLRSIWKSQPDVNVDPNRKYSMPKLKPILPKQSSRYVLTKIPKVTHYTEFLMSSEYKDPVNIPKDRIGFVATHLHTQRHKRNKANARAKFGPLPFIPSPEKEKPACKKIRLEHSDDDLYDLTQCKRQSGNKLKPKDVQKKPNGNNVEEILKRLKEFSKDYQHYFGLMPKPRRRTVMCKNAIVQASGEGECRTSEAFKTVRTAVCSWSRGTQTSTQRDEFRKFRNYVKNQNEASQKGLLMISGRKSTKDLKINLGIKNQKGEENTQKDDVTMSKTNGIVNCDQTNTVESTRLRHSKEEEKTVVHSKVVEEKQNSENDVTVFKTGTVSLMPKSEINKDGGSVESSKVQTTLTKNEELVVHPENHPRLTGDVTKAQNNGVSTTSIKQPTSQFRTDDTESLVVQKEPEKSQSNILLKENLTDDVKTPESNSVLLSFQKTAKLKENSVDIEPSKVQNTHLENEELDVYSENHPEANRGNDDVTATQENGVSLIENNKFPKIPSGRNKELVDSENRSSLVIKESQQNDDVIKTQKVPVKESQQLINEEELVVHSKIQSPLETLSVVKEKQNGDDVTKTDVLFKVQVPKSHTDGGCVESSTVKQTDPIDDVTNGFAKLESINNKDDVINPQNDSVLDKSKEFCSGCLESGSNPVSSLENETFSAQNQTPRGDDVIKPQNDFVLNKSEEFRTGCTENGLNPVSSLENETVTAQNQTPRGDDVTTSINNIQSTQSISSPVIVSNQNGHEPQKNDEKVKKPEEILCVPDFETPRSSRVTVKTTEEEIKPRKGRSSPKKVHGRYSKNSPDESFRFDGKRSGKEELVEEVKDTSGIAGAIAQLSLQAGSEQTPESTAASAAHQEYLRRQNWETGNIDYMGRDSFDNIWSKICQTLEAKDQEPPTTGGETKKPSETVPNVPEFIETLPGKPAPGPVEDDEIIFSKPDSRQSGLTNISEEEEAGGNGVKLSDILGKGQAKPVGGVGDGKAPVSGAAEGKIEPFVLSSDVKSQVLPAGVAPLPSAVDAKAGSEVKAQPPTGATEVKAQPPTGAPEVKAQPPTGAPEVKAQPPTGAVEVKTQPPTGAPEVKTQPPTGAMEIKTQPPTGATEVKTQPPTGATEVKAQPPTGATEIKAQPPTGATEVKPQPPTGATEVKAQPPTGATEIKAQPPTGATEVKPQPPTGAMEVKTQPPTGATEVKTQPPAGAPEVKAEQPPSSTEPKAQLPGVSDNKIEPLVPPSDAKAQPEAAGTEKKPEITTDVKAQLPTAPVEVKPELPVVSEGKIQPPAPLPDIKPQPAAQPQPTTTPAEIKTQLPVASVETTPQAVTSDSTATEIKSQPPPTTEIKPQVPVETTPQVVSSVKPTAETPTGECKVVAIPSPPILPPSTVPKSRQQQERPQVQLEPIPLPPPDSPSSEQPVKAPDTSKDEGKQKKGVFSKILEMVGVKEKNGSDETKSVFYDVESGGELKEGGKEGEGKQPEAKEVGKQTESKQPEVKEVGKVAESKQSEGKETAKQTEVKEVGKQVEGKQPEVKESEMTKPEMAQPEKSSKDPQQTIQTSKTTRKSPSPKLTMPPKPDTAVTTPTPPPNQEIPPIKNPALLKVDETILETPPVPEPSNIQTEIEDIIGKAKSEVENLIEKGTSEVVNTMKLIMGEEQQEEVEELKVTSEEERKRHKGEVVSSKLSDQILKAIPPPRRKAISEATASTSAIPKATTEPKSSQPAEGKPKSTKPSSIPVPPPRNKGKPQPPPPSKGKGKK